MRILFASANDWESYLDIETEQRTMQKLVEAGNHSLELMPAVEKADLEDALKREKDPFDVVHFSGHGEKGEGLVFSDGTLSGEGLRELLKKGKKNQVKLVVLNACNSKEVADSIRDDVGVAIGTDAPVPDSAAYLFTTTFYGVLKDKNCSVKAAFEAAQKAKTGTFRYQATLDIEELDKIRLPTTDGLAADQKIVGVEEFYKSFYGRYIDQQIGSLESDRDLNNYLFYGMASVAVCLWIFLLHRGDYGLADSVFWPNLKESLGTAFRPGEGENVDVFSIQGLWDRVDQLRAFAPILIAFFQRRVSSHIKPKLDGLPKLRERVANWDDLSEEDRDMVRSVMHTSLKEALEK